MPMNCQYCGQKGVEPGGLCPNCSRVNKAIELNAAMDVSVESILTDTSLSDEQRHDMMTKSFEQYRDSILALTKGSPDASAATDNLETDDMADESVTKAEVTELLKGLSPEQTAVVADLIAKAAEKNAEILKAEITKAQADATAARSEIAKRDREALAKSIVGDTAYKAEDVAAVLEKAGDNKEVQTLLQDVFAKYASALKAGAVLKELGSERGTDVSDPDAAITAGVADLMKADSKLTKAAAYAKFITDNPAIYAASLK